MIVALENAKYHDILDVECDACSTIYKRRKRDVLKSRAIFDKDVCRSCAATIASKSKPQCSSEGWSAAKRQTHGAIMRESPAYREGLARRPSVSGSSNPMFGKRASDQTRAKMRQSRLGKLGPNATAWRGGRTRFLARLRRLLETRYRWYSRVVDRANHSCERCGGPGKEGHHLKPIGEIVPKLLKGRNFSTDEEALEWLLTQETLVDADLSNGICVCRPCHKNEHLNWGSHEPQTR